MSSPETPPSIRVHPLTRSPPQSSPLSIIDSSVANYTICGALWLFPRLSSSASKSTSPSPSTSIYTRDALLYSLSTILDAYPQWCGRLHIPPYDAQAARNDYTRRYGRVWLSWGGDDDPGADVTFAEHAKNIDSVLPPKVQGVRGVHDASSLGSELFVDSSRLVDLRAPSSEGTKSAPCMLVKITFFADGGVGIAAGLHHTLSDAQCLARFVADWAEVHRAQTHAAHSTKDEGKHRQVGIVLPCRPFAPLELDKYAAGCLNDTNEDEVLRSRALQLPQIRLDMWASGDGKPGMITSPTRPPAEVAQLDTALGSVRGRPIPWSTWEYEKPVRDYALDFTPEQVQRIWSRASVPTPEQENENGKENSAGGDGEEGTGTDSDHPPSGGARISRLDALLAHLWRLSVRARRIPANELCSLDMSVGLRPRLGLHPTFLGSPLNNFSAALSAGTITSPSPSPAFSTAQAIRNVVSSVNADTIPPLLHHHAFALDPIRERNAFMGGRHMLVTGWLGIGSYDVDFGGGPPVLMVSQMWAIDGLVVVMEVPAATSVVAALDSKSQAPKWYDHGVRVRMFCQNEVMDRLIADPELYA